MTAPLTRRQREVLALVAQGYTHAEIGEALRISERGAKDHTARLRRIAGVRRKSELVRWAQGRT